MGALGSNTTASYNTAVGYQAGYANTTGADNSILGYLAGSGNTTGSQNTFIGRSAGVTNQTGAEIVAVGFSAMGNCGTVANYNTAVGRAALNNVTGTLNVGLGNGSGSAITSGSKNTILGNYSGNQGGLDIRTADNYIVLSDGDGNPRAYWNGSGNLYNAGTIGFGSNAAKAALNSSTVTNITAGSSQVIYGFALAGNLGAYMMVIGVDASNYWFCDFLTFLNSNTVTLLAGMNGGSPGSRTYAVASGTLSLNPSVTQTTVRISANELSL